MYDKTVDIKLSFLGAQNQGLSGPSNIKSNRYGLVIFDPEFIAEWLLIFM